MKILIKVITSVIIVILITAIFLTTCTKEVSIRGTVVEHQTTSTRGGNITYYTVVKCDDGYIRSEVGLDLYIKPIGETVYITERVMK